jgi:hypothetical protein
MDFERAEKSSQEFVLCGKRRRRGRHSGNTHAKGYEELRETRPEKNEASLAFRLASFFSGGGNRIRTGE